MALSSRGKGSSGMGFGLAPRIRARRNKKSNDHKARFGANEYCESFLKRNVCPLANKCLSRHSWCNQEDIMPPDEIQKYNSNISCGINNNSELKTNEEQLYNEKNAYLQKENIKLVKQNKILTTQFQQMSEYENKYNELKTKLVCIKDENNTLKTEINLLSGNNLNEQKCALLQFAINKLQKENDDLANKNNKLKSIEKKSTTTAQQLKQYKQSNDLLTKQLEYIQTENILLKKQISETDENKNEEIINKDDDDICSKRFEYWLCNIVRLKQYLSIFKEHEANDITFIEEFDEYIIKNQFGIHNKLHCKKLRKEIQIFKNEVNEFRQYLEMHKELKQCEDQLLVNGIITVNELKKNIKTNNDVKKILQINNKKTIKKILTVINGCHQEGQNNQTNYI